MDIGQLLLVLLLLVASAASGKKEEVKIGVVVANTQDVAGKKSLVTVEMALSDLYTAHPEYKTRLLLHPRSSGGDIVASAAAVLDLIKNVQVEAIIGPEISMEALFDISIGRKAHVPIISYSATSPFLSSVGSEYFIQVTQVDSAQVQAITSIIQAFGWRQVVPVYVDNEFGGGLIPTLTDALQAIGTRIPYRSAISSIATDDQIIAELYKLKSVETRVFIAHMESPLGIRLFAIARNLGMVTRDYVWIVTNGIGNELNTLSRKDIQYMQGVVGVRTYYPYTKELKDFIRRWKRKVLQESLDVQDPQITVFDLWAYDATTSLARAVEQVGGTRTKFVKTNASSDASSIDLSVIGVSQAGQKLIKAIRGTRFTGLSGDFELIDGQLQSPVLEIINVIGEVQKTVGVWAPQFGFLKEMNSTVESKYSISKDKLGSITWPGGSNDPPKGWAIPADKDKKLRILVPVKDGFEQFVKVEYEFGSDKPNVTGFCIDIFNAVMTSLNYSVPYEYVPFSRPNKAPTESYDEFISQVYFKNYDAAVGDVTIIANRSLYVDFTLPYTDSGVVMIAPIKDNRKMNWVFIRPLSWDLWITSLCYFVFFAMVIWVLEHPINPQFRGPTQYQIGTSLYYSFSTMVFAHGQQVLSNLGRCVVVIWLFFVLILTQSYTASLASMLTAQQLQPTETGIDELIKSGKTVGYQEGSFVKGLLIEKGFNASNLKAFKSVKELDDLLTKGSKNGGIAAAFDEIPFVKVFLSSPAHCSKYMSVPPTYKADGLGFVFPLGSPLVADVSRQVLSVTEGGQMDIIEGKWFPKQTGCIEFSRTSEPPSQSLGLHSFRELFIITGSIAVCALIIFFIRFLQKHKQVWMNANHGISIWGRAKELARIFNQRNMESHTFNMSEQQTTCPLSPSVICNHSDALLARRYLDPSSVAGGSSPEMVIEMTTENPHTNERLPFRGLLKLLIKCIMLNSDYFGHVFGIIRSEKYLIKKK